jgi:hypothetical protein
MNSYDQVKDLVARGEIEITYIDHLPRTISHALARSLFEVYDGYVNEPFFSSASRGTEEGFTGFDTACSSILKEYARVKAEAPDKHPVTILIKDVAKSLPGKYWGEWLGLTKNVISLVRDPHLQLYSLMEAIANDNHNPGENRATREEVLRRGEAISRALRLFGTSDMNTTSWNPIAAHETVLAQHMAEHPEKEHIVLDGNILLLDPANTLKSVMERIGNPAYSPHMVTDWSKSANGFPNERNWGKSIVEVDGTRRNAWTNNAFSKSGFKPSANRPLPLEQFPPRIRNHLLNDCLPAYLDMLESPQNIAPRTMQQMSEVLRTPVDETGKTFRNACPTSAYAFIATMPDETLSHLDKITKRAELDAIRSNNPEHATFFAAVDQHVRGKYHQPAASKERA